ncbi:MAG: Aspartate transaminase [Acidobacteriales bacterium]|nr:Aspartate transaminase [Terriglobales bacterium]
MIGLSRIASDIAQSEIRVMSVECERVRGVNLAQGVCDTEVPLTVRRAAAAAIESGANQYTRLDGIPTLRQAIANKLRDYNGLNVDPEREVLVTSGATGGFSAACLALLNPGDEVIIFEPFYGYHTHTLTAMNVVPVFVRLAAPDWNFDPADVEGAITPRTRAVVINSPANPSGKVFSRGELQSLAEIVIRHDLLLITDEIYEYFLYDGHQHISAASLPGMAERTITISGFSKTFSITGWRVGYLACPAKWKTAIGYFHDLAYVCAPSPFQHGAAAGLNDLDASFYSDLRREYLQKRDMLCQALTVAGLTPSIPQGSYYVLADSSSLAGSNSKQKAMTLLNETGVASVPGAAFYHDNSGDNLLRFCFAKKTEDLENACGRLQRLRSPAAV